MHVRAAERLGIDLLAGRGAHQRRSAEEYPALVAHDDGVIGHGGHVRAARRAGAVHHGDLRDALRRQARLVEEDAPEMIAVGKHLVLFRQERAAALHQVDARQRVLAGDLLGAQMLLHGERVVSAALHGRIVGDDHAGAPRDPADAGDEPGARQVIVVHIVRRERRELEKRRAGIEQRVDPLAHQELPRLAVLVARRRAAAPRVALEQRAQLRHQGLHGGAIGGELGRAHIDARGDLGHCSYPSGCRRHCHSGREAQNCRTIRLSNDSGSEDNGVEP